MTEVNFKNKDRKKFSVEEVLSLISLYGEAFGKLIRYKGEDYQNAETFDNIWEAASRNPTVAIGIFNASLKQEEYKGYYYCLVYTFYGLVYQVYDEESDKKCEEGRGEFDSFPKKKKDDFIETLQEYCASI